MSRRSPSHPEIVAGSLRSITPDEQPAAISGPGVVGPPAWFVALKNVETKLDEHAKQDAANHQATMAEIGKLKSRNGFLAAIGASFGGGVGYGLIEAFKLMFGG
jgi:hypothetical protein